jgi:hypothetical protein
MKAKTNTPASVAKKAAVKFSGGSTPPKGAIPSKKMGGSTKKKGKC